MKSTKILAIVLTGLLTLLVFSTVYSTTLNDTVQDQTSTSDINPSSAETIPYRGNLTNEGGNTVTDGIYAFKFSIYKDQNQDESIWSEEQEGVEVESGVFTVQLGSVQPLPAEALQSDQLLLQVSVRGHGDETFIALNPPQVLQSVAGSAPLSINAQAACAHDHLGEEWTSSGNLAISGSSRMIINNSGYGSAIYATATDNENAAIYGENFNDFGVAGRGGSTGVYGLSWSGYGVLGEGTIYGVYGYGLESDSYGGWFGSVSDHRDIRLHGNVGRINADDNDDSALYLSSNGDIRLMLDNDGGEEHVLRVQKSGGTDVCTIDESGNLWCAGTISEGASTAQYGERLLYPIGSPEVLFEDFGMGTLKNGEAHIEFEQIFAETVNLGENYHVFLTPVCDQPLVLNVSAKTPSGFSVQGVKLDGTPSNCTFDYRIVAKRLGYESLRLERVSTDLEETN